MCGVEHDAGEEADVAFVAKDAKGFQKSLGADVFTVSWERAGDDEPATFGQLPSLKHTVTSLMHKITFPSIHTDIFHMPFERASDNSLPRMVRCGIKICLTCHMHGIIFLSIQPIIWTLSRKTPRQLPKLFEPHSRENICTCSKMRLLGAGKVVDLGTGEYTAKFTATSAGAYSVSIKHQGSNIAGSPFPAEVLHTSIAADCSYVVQEGLEKAVSGQQVSKRPLSETQCPWKRKATP